MPSLPLGSLSSGDQPFYLEVAASFLASLLSLGQTIEMVPKGGKSRPALWALAALPLITFLGNVYVDSVSSMSLLRLDQYPRRGPRPKGRADFDALLHGSRATTPPRHQSTADGYGLEPPSGFEAWYDYAVARESPIIDDFDMIHEAIAPFSKDERAQVREATKEMSGAGGADLFICDFKNETGQTHCNNPSRSDGRVQEAFNRWLGNMTAEIPEMQFLVNYLDEPRVMLPGPDSTMMSTSI